MSGVSNKTKTDGLLLSVFIASSMSGWLGCLHLSLSMSAVADRCLLLYNGLTQGQGHTVRQLLLVESEGFPSLSRGVSSSGSSVVPLSQQSFVQLQENLCFDKSSAPFSFDSSEYSLEEMVFSLPPNFGQNSFFSTIQVLAP